MAGWTALTATTGSLAGELLLGAYSLAHPGFESQPYQTFVIYAGYIALATIINLWGSRLLPLVNSAAIIWSLSGAVIVIIVTLATATPNYQNADFVFRTFLNESGWNSEPILFCCFLSLVRDRFTDAAFLIRRCRVDSWIAPGTCSHRDFFRTS